MGTLAEVLNPEQQRTLDNVRAAAGRIWARPLRRHYTDHGVEHSERIIALLDGLTAVAMTTGKRLGPNEALILLCAAYLHDIGMQDERFASGALDPIREAHHELAAELIYRAAEDPAQAVQLGLPGDPGLVEAVALVAKGHRKVDLGADEYEPLVLGGETLHLRLLAALLRFADELDIDHRRVDLEQMKLMGLSVDSQLHWWKCHYVSGVSIADEYIRITYRLPQARPDYAGLIVPLVEGEVRAKLAALEEIFRAGGIKAALGKSQVRLMRAVKPLPPEVEALVAGKVAGDSQPAQAVAPGPSGPGRAAPPGTSSVPRPETEPGRAPGQGVPVASRKTDLERNIRASYALIRDYESIIQTSDQPKEKLRARREIDEQRGLIEGYLAEYHRLAGGALPADIAEMAAVLPPPTAPPPAPAATPSTAFDQRGQSVDTQINIELQQLRLEARVPEKVDIGRAFDLAVSIYQLSSPGRVDGELARLGSAEMQVAWSKSGSLYGPSVSLRIEISAPECTIQGQSSQAFRLYRNQDSPVFYFHLTPNQTGEISIIVRVYQQDDWMGSARVHTLACERIVGDVRMSVTSHSLAKDDLDKDPKQTNTAALRSRLQRLDAVQIESLCLDHFPEVYDRFGRGLRRDEMINLLLNHCRHKPGDVARLMLLLA